jgi:hypothetical protein
MTSIVRIRAIVTGVAGSPAYMTFYFNGDGSAAEADNDAVGVFMAQVDASMSTSANWRTDSVAALIDSTNGSILSLISVTPNTGTGSDGSSLLPPATQLLLQWRTGVFQDGREIRGRLNIPYLTEGSNDAGGVASASLTSNVQDAADDLVAGVGSDQLVVWSRKSGAVPNVDTATVSNIWAVLRSRRD